MQEKQEKQDALIESLKEEILFIKGLKYARKSEKWTAEDKKQMDLFNEIEQITDGSDQASEEPVKKTSNGKNVGRKPIPESIPQVTTRRQKNTNSTMWDAWLMPEENSMKQPR